jgi:hypothetical protein
VQEWKQRPGRDNHLFDCLVGNAVGAGHRRADVLGGGGGGHGAPEPKKEKKPVKWSEVQKAKRMTEG